MTVVSTYHRPRSSSHFPRTKSRSQVRVRFAYFHVLCPVLLTVGSPSMAPSRLPSHSIIVTPSWIHWWASHVLPCSSRTPPASDSDMMISYIVDDGIQTRTTRTHSTVSTALVRTYAMRVPSFTHNMLAQNQRFNHADVPSTRHVQVDSFIARITQRTSTRCT